MNENEFGLKTSTIPNRREREREKPYTVKVSHTLKNGEKYDKKTTQPLNAKVSLRVPTPKKKSK